MLNDPKKPSPPNKPSLYTISTPEGVFDFSTGVKGDGTLPGSYIVTFAQLHPHGRCGFLPPDELKNLYNDPDQNAEKPEFHIELTPPARTTISSTSRSGGSPPSRNRAPMRRLACSDRQSRRGAGRLLRSLTARRFCRGARSGACEESHRNASGFQEFHSKENFPPDFSSFGFEIIPLARQTQIQCSKSLA